MSLTSKYLRVGAWNLCSAAISQVQAACITHLFVAALLPTKKYFSFALVLTPVT